MQLRSSRTIGLIIILVIFSIVGLLFFHFSNFDLLNNINNSKSLTNDDLLNNPVETPVSYLSFSERFALEENALKSIPKEPKPVISLKNTGWIPDWGLEAGFETLKNFSNEFYSVSPFWLMPQEDGHIKEVSNSTNQDIKDFAIDNNIHLIPTIPLFDADLFSKIFEDKEKYKIFMKDVMSIVDKNNYAGIDLDFEDTKLEDKQIFIKLLTDLKSELSSENKSLVFTALPKWSDVVVYLGHPQTRQVQDYKQISDIVDEIRIMTYDFYGRDSDEAGPVAPLEWLERVIQYAIFSGVPREKIVLGVPTYAYDWSDRRIASSINLSTDYTGLGSIFNLEPGDAYYHSGVEKVIKNYNLDYSFNEIWGEAIGRYDYNGVSRIVVFPTDESIQLRKQLAADYGLKGVAFWKLGSEGELKL